MAQDIVPIELGLPQGDVVTLWAPRWQVDGEEWEAFLGDGDALYAFPDPARLAAFARTTTQHDLDDHPAWHVVPALSAAELIPDEDHQFDLVGVPELVAEPPDTWTIKELADIVEIARSLADVCELDKVHEVLDAAEGFALLGQGTLVFSGRDGQKRWDQLCDVVAQRWDDLLDAIDAVVSTPSVPADAVAVATAELAEATEPEDDPADSTEDDVEEVLEPSGFWAEVGIDPIRIITPDGDYYTLRCYVDDEPVFLGARGRIDVFRSPRALVRHLAEEQDPADNDMAKVETWPEVVDQANAGELEVTVGEDNTYLFTGLADDLAAGPSQVDPLQLDLAEELLTDAAAWAGDDSAEAALRPSERLGWLVSFVLRPDPQRLPPSPPFDAEATAWRDLTDAFEKRLRLI
jgi:hypothetical protein